MAPCGRLWSCLGTRPAVSTLGFGLRPKRLAPLAFIIPLDDDVALGRFLDLFGQLRGFLFSRKSFPIEGRVGPANMIVNLRTDVLAFHSRTSSVWGSGRSVIRITLRSDSIGCREFGNALIFRLLTNAPDANRIETSRNLRSVTAVLKNRLRLLGSSVEPNINTEEGRDYGALQHT